MFSIEIFPIFTLLIQLNNFKVKSFIEAITSINVNFSRELKTVELKCEKTLKS
jgi:hypothetical protein